MVKVIYYTDFQKDNVKDEFSTVNDALKSVLEYKTIRQEVLDLLQFNYKSIKTMEIANEFDFITPLTVHSTYSREQVMAALGYFNEEKCPAFREGVIH